MTYRFEQPKRLAAEIRRVAEERLDDALAQLEGPALSENSAVAIHTARKDLKKARSLIRLVRGPIGRSRARTENDRLRTAAHELAATRERDAMGAALESLLERSRPDMSDECAKAISAWTSPDKPGEGSTQDGGAAAGRAAILINEARDDARLWELGDGGWDLIEPGLLRLYRLGRAALAEAMRSTDDETVHEWRKRVKDLWYALRLIEPVWPAVLRPQAEEAHRLSEILGDHHDLGEIAAAAESGILGLPQAASAELVGIVRARQDELISEGFELGRRLYAEPAKRFVQRLALLWEAWEDEADSEARHVPQAGRPAE